MTRSFILTTENDVSVDSVAQALDGFVGNATITQVGEHGADLLLGFEDWLREKNISPFSDDAYFAEQVWMAARCAT